MFLFFVNHAVKLENVTEKSVKWLTDKKYIYIYNVVFMVSVQQYCRFQLKKLFYTFLLFSQENDSCFTTRLRVLFHLF